LTDVAPFGQVPCMTMIGGSDTDKQQRAAD
jgi:hypothetical protein